MNAPNSSSATGDSADNGATSSDSGRQGERTTLAWTRTALAATVAALLITRYGVVRHDTPLTVSGVVLLVAAAVVALGSSRRQRQIESDVLARRSPVDRTAMLGVTVLVAVVGVAALWAVLAAA